VRHVALVGDGVAGVCGDVSPIGRFRDGLSSVKSVVVGCIPDIQGQFACV
jgi:hypothetical protein